MKSLQENMIEYRTQLQKGAISQAYRGLMQYIMDLRTYLKNKYPDFFVSGSLYYGYMDMTYFSFFPRTLKNRNLKIAIVFVHETYQFEAWLAGSNRQEQQKYWQLIKESGWDKYRLVTPGKGVDSILEHVLVADPDFDNLNALTNRIDQQTLNFIEDIERFITDNQI